MKKLDSIFQRGYTTNDNFKIVNYKMMTRFKTVPVVIKPTKPIDFNMEIYDLDIITEYSRN